MAAGGWWSVSNGTSNVSKLTQEEKPALKERKAVQTGQNPKDLLTYVWIPPGAFRMGCSNGDKECFDDEKPARDVTIDHGFWIGQTEVTQAAYKLVMGADPSSFKGADLPVETVSWDEADKYCHAIGGNLPTEEQWEYAARAGNQEARYGPVDKVAWYAGNSGLKTHPVRGKDANALGIYDMLGNVWEWTDSWSGSGKTSRVLRGGSWVNQSRLARVSHRFVNHPSVRGLNVGFRCSGEKLVP